MRNIIVFTMVICVCLDSVSVVSLESIFSSTWDKITKSWNDMIAAIKRPVRPRRLGYLGKRKHSKISSPIFSIETGVVELTSAMAPTSKLPPWKNLRITKDLSLPQKGVAIEMPPQVKKISFHEENSVTPDSQRLSLPYIKQPMWRTIDEWKRMQWPHFVKLLRDEKIEDSESLTAAKDKLTDMNEEDNLGMLFFV